jgi:chemotaxis signal transduction protein
VNRHLRVVVGRERYALSVHQVRAVELLGVPTPVPGAGRHVSGVRSLRGELLPVVDLAGMLGLEAGTARRLVVVEDGLRRAGLAVDRVEDIEVVDETQITPGASALTLGSVVGTEHLVGILDIAATLDTATQQG